MHRSTSQHGKFGFDVDNTIGSTHQPNLPWMDDWADFWDTHRLGHMLKLTDNAGGLSDTKIQELRQKTRELLSHKPAPSLLHGDLWGGNKGFCKKDGKSIPVIFDPAVYYGDREADVAMTGLFGGFGNDFYDGYNSEWPLPEVRLVQCFRGEKSCSMFRALNSLEPCDLTVFAFVVVSRVIHYANHRVTKSELSCTIFSKWSASTLVASGVAVQ